MSRLPLRITGFDARTARRSHLRTAHCVGWSPTCVAVHPISNTLVDYSSCRYQELPYAQTDPTPTTDVQKKKKKQGGRVDRSQAAPPAPVEDPLRPSVPRHHRLHDRDRRGRGRASPPPGAVLLRPAPVGAPATGRAHGADTAPGGAGGRGGGAPAARPYFSGAVPLAALPPELSGAVFGTAQHDEPRC